VVLKGFKGFNASLDTKTDLTGKHTVYKQMGDLQVCYHVSTLIPIYPSDPTRKRHIGNDCVVIIFREGKEPLDLSLIRSQVNQVFVVVRKERAKDRTIRYRVEFANKKPITPYPPYLPEQLEDSEEDQIRFITKLINADRTALRTVPLLSTRMSGLRQQRLLNLTESYQTIKSRRLSSHVDQHRLPNKKKRHSMRATSKTSKIHLKGSNSLDNLARKGRSRTSSGTKTKGSIAMLFGTKTYHSTSEIKPAPKKRRRSKSKPAKVLSPISTHSRRSASRASLPSIPQVEGRAFECNTIHL